MAVKMAITHQLLHLNKQVTYVQTEILVCWFLSGYKIGGKVRFEKMTATAGLIIISRALGMGDSVRFEKTLVKVIEID